ncbi:MAG: hypothetical protein ACR2QV_14120 [Gammaproteobacteria bacterium]
MIEDNKDPKKTEADEGFEPFEDTLQMEAKTENSDNVGDPSVELDVEEIVAEMEAEMGTPSPRDGKDARKRLEELLEERRAAREMGEIEDFVTDDA